MDSSAECPAAPRSKTTVYTRTLHKACELLGGIGALAGALGVSEERLFTWMEGNDIPPTRTFLIAVDIVMSRGNESAD